MTASGTRMKYALIHGRKNYEKNRLTVTRSRKSQKKKKSREPKGWLKGEGLVVGTKKHQYRVTSRGGKKWKRKALVPFEKKGGGGEGFDGQLVNLKG